MCIRQRARVQVRAAACGDNRQGALWRRGRRADEPFEAVAAAAGGSAPRVSSHGRCAVASGEREREGVCVFECERERERGRETLGTYWYTHVAGLDWHNPTCIRGYIHTAA